MSDDGGKKPGTVWPGDVEPINLNDLNRIGIDAENRLYWDGKQVETKSFITLSKVQSRLAIATAIVAIFAGMATMVTGFNNLSIFLCARNIAFMGCPVR